MRRGLALAMVLVLAACSSASDPALPGDSSDHAPFAGIAAGQVIHLTGTEPFWGGKIEGDRLLYTTPENQKGTPIEVKRFSGRAGIAFSGEIDGKAIDLTVTQGECSDGMSDRTYPFTATLLIGGETRNGCAWTS